MVFDIFYLMVIVMCGLAVPVFFFRNIDARHQLHLRNLFFYHLLLGTAFYFVTTNGGGDAWGYWKISRNLSWAQFVEYLTESRGTYFMYALNFIPAKVLGMSFFTNTMLYSLIGYLGIVYLYVITLQLVPYNSKYKGYKLFPLIFYLPTLHFWSAGLGKDTILFWCIGMFAYGMLNIAKRIPLLLLSFLISFFLRPHITLFLLLAFAFAFLIDAKTSKLRRMTILLLLCVGSVMILPVVLKFTKIEDASVESFNKFSKTKAVALSYSGSSVDISSYPLPLKVLTFLYRPLFFDSRGVPAIVASFENLLLLILTLKVLRNEPLEVFRSAPFLLKGLVFFLLIGTLAFSQSLGNLGIMIRMRNMFLPGMLMYFLWSFSCARKKALALTQKLR